MQNNIMPFAFGENLVRVITDENGEPWFVAKDVCRVLELDDSNLSRQGYLDDDEKGLYTVQTPGGEQKMLTISESGLYTLIFRSRKPEAKRFRKWVTAEVLPSIRKTGHYAMLGAMEETSKTDIPIRTAKIPLPEDLPPEALNLRPMLRQKLWQEALQTARLDGADSSVALEWFGFLCKLVSAQPPAPTPARDKVRLFFHECCEYASGHRVSASALYEAFRRWHKGQKGDLPSMRTFGMMMLEFAKRCRSNGVHYDGMRLKAFIS